MSDGGGESGKRVREQLLAKKKLVAGSSDEFPQAIAKIAIAQICESAGFQTFQQSALETLSDIAVRYIHNIGKTANCYANLAGRTEGCVFDIIQGLEELSSAQGFAGSSDIEHCLGSSGTIREIVQYVSEPEAMPFAYSVPSFPVVKDRSTWQSFLQIGNEPPGSHVPAWLPAFPDPNTYLQLPAENEVPTDSDVEKIELARQQRQTEQSLLNLQQRLAGNGSEGCSSVNLGNATKVHVVESNPFLAAPLQFGEKEVSSVALPARLLNEAALENPVVENPVVGNHVSVLQTFAPAIEAMNSRLSDSEEGIKKVLSDRRPAVQFKIRIGRKSIGTTLDLSPRSKAIQKIGPWSGKDCEMDDKKRRAGKILMESMENPEELAQL